MITGAAQRILDLIKCEVIIMQKKAVSIAAKTREDIASVIKKYHFFSGYYWDFCVKEFSSDCMPVVQRKKRVDTKGKRKKLRKTADG